MSYTPVKQQPNTDIDAIGNTLGLPRFKDEPLATYRRRLVGETTNRSGPTQRELIRTLSRRVGKFDLPVFDIELITDVNDMPLATDPRIEITSSWIRAYPIASGDPEIEVNFYNEDAGKFLVDIQTAFAASTYFTLTTLVDYDPWLISRNLQFGSSLEYVEREILGNSIQNKLKNGFITDIVPSNPQVFVNEVETLGAVLTFGDYYIDYQNGVLFTYSTMGGLISYYYNKFPYRVFWQPLKIYPYGDEDKQYFHRNAVISDITGEEAPAILNSKGIAVANLVYSVHPLTWGK